MALTISQAYYIKLIFQNISVAGAENGLHSRGKELIWEIYDKTGRISAYFLSFVKKKCNDVAQWGLGTKKQYYRRTSVNYN
jgi:hypothetical protein